MKCEVYRQQICVLRDRSNQLGLDRNNLLYIHCLKIYDCFPRSVIINRIERREGWFVKSLS